MTEYREDLAPEWLCLRCHHPGNEGDRCDDCGIHRDRRVVRHYRRSRPIGGKRGRNSGKVHTHG